MRAAVRTRRVWCASVKYTASAATATTHSARRGRLCCTAFAWTEATEIGFHRARRVEAAERRLAQAEVKLEAAEKCEALLESLEEAHERIEDLQLERDISV